MECSTFVRVSCEELSGKFLRRCLGRTKSEISLRRTRRRVGDRRRIDERILRPVCRRHGNVVTADVRGGLVAVLSGGKFRLRTAVSRVGSLSLHIDGGHLDAAATG